MHMQDSKPNYLPEKKGTFPIIAFFLLRLSSLTSQSLYMLYAPVRQWRKEILELPQHQLLPALELIPDHFFSCISFQHLTEERCERRGGAQKHKTTK